MSRHKQQGPWGQLVKAVSGSGSTPPPGFVPVPASKVGLWHKKVGAKYVYWKPKAPSYGIDQGGDLPPIPEVPKTKAPKAKVSAKIPGLGVTADEFDAGIEPVIYMIPLSHKLKPIMEHFGWSEVAPDQFEKSFKQVNEKTQKTVTRNARFHVDLPPAEVGGGIPYEVAQSLGSAHAQGMLSLAMNATASELHAAELLGYTPAIGWHERILGFNKGTDVLAWKKGDPAPADVKAAMAALEAAKKPKKKGEPKHPTEIEDDKRDAAEAEKERKALTYTAPPPGRNDFPDDHEKLNKGVRLLTRLSNGTFVGNLQDMIKAYPEVPVTDILKAVTLFTAGHVPSCRDPSKWDAEKAVDVVKGVGLTYQYGGKFNYSVKPTRENYVYASDMLMDLAAVPYRGTSTVPIGRGMRLPPAVLKQIAVGQVLELGVASSFTKSDAVATRFMENPQNDVPDHWPMVKLNFEPGTLKRGCDVSALSTYLNEQEVIVGGKIRITKKAYNPKNDVTTLTVVQDEPS